MENTENKLEIWGSGREFLIGTLTEDEAERIKDDEPLEEILEDVDEADDVLHIYGPDIDEVVLKHQDEEVTFKHFSFVLEPTWEFRDDFEEYLNEQISEYLEDEMEITAEHDFKNDFQELTNKLQEKPEEKIFLIQDRVEKGHWGEMTVEEKYSFDEIILIGLQLEGMGTYANLLVGYLIVSNGSFEFNTFDYEPSTEGESSSTHVYDNNTSDTVWTS